MTMETTVPIEPKPIDAPVARPPRSPQDKAQAAEIIAFGQTLSAVLQAVSTPGPVADALNEGGFREAEIQAGQALQVEASSALADHLAALGAKLTATRVYLAAEKAYTSAYTNLRGLVRSAYLKDSGALTALGVSGTQPRDMENLIRVGDTLLENAVLPDYVVRLGKRGVTAAKLQNFQTKLAALKAADMAQEDAKGASLRATARREQAAAALKAWMIEFKAFAKVQFKDQPDILKSWGIK